LILRKKTIVKQPDIYYNLFKPIAENENLSLNLEHVVKILIHFIHSLNNESIPLQPSFYTILILFLKRLKNRTFIAMLLQYKAIPDNFELAKFLLEMGEDYIQLGIDMLVRLKKYEDIFMLLMSAGRLTEGLLYLRKFKIDLTLLTPQQKEMIKNLLSDPVNNSLLQDYLKS
jgi:hypothetical protein